MANEELTIEKEKARLTVIGNSYPDTLTDSGPGFDIPELIVDALDELGIELPDWGPIVPPDLVIGLDPDTGIPTLEYPDPEWEEPEWPDPDISDHDWPEPDWPDNDLPDILDYPLSELDWDDFIDKLEDIGQNLDYDFDPDALKDLSFTGLNDLGIPTLVSLDMDFNIREDNCPASIVIVTPPNKTEYQDGERIDLTGMVVTAKKADGSTWTSAEYPNGHIPLGELMLPQHADISQSETKAAMPEYMSLDTLEAIQSIIDPGYICDIFTDDFPVDEQEGEARERMQEGIDAMRKEFQDAVSEAHGIACYAWCGNPPPAEGSWTTLHNNWCGVVSIVGPPDAQGYCSAVIDHWGYVKQYTGEFSLIAHGQDNSRYPLFQGVRDGAEKLFSAINAGLIHVQNVDVEWTSPCFQQLTSSFDVVVDERQDHDGTHHGNGGR